MQSVKGAFRPFVPPFPSTKQSGAISMEMGTAMFWSEHGHMTTARRQIKDLTGTSQQDLFNKMVQAKTTYINSQGALVSQRQNTDEHQAYAVSDPIAPQYVYQNCGHY